jgi:hypothetical protein
VSDGVLFASFSALFPTNLAHSFAAPVVGNPARIPSLVSDHIQIHGLEAGIVVDTKKVCLALG